MTTTGLSTTARRLSLLAATAIALALATPASAQQYDRYDDPSYRNSTDEQIEVIAPRYHPRSSTTGAPIRDVALSRDVRFDDLNLRTSWGARQLKARIRYAATDLCQKLNIRYPVSADNSPPCYQTAVHRAMYQADRAISDARNEADENY
jgi:UrcA family protein